MRQRSSRASVRRDENTLLVPAGRRVRGAGKTQQWSSATTQHVLHVHRQVGPVRWPRAPNPSSLSAQLRTPRRHTDTPKTPFPGLGRSLSATNRQRNCWSGRSGEIDPDHGEWSWRESNPRPLSGHRPRYDHSRSVALNGCHAAGSVGLTPAAGSFPGVNVLSRGQRSLPAVLHCFCCRAAVDWPRVPRRVAMFATSPEWIRRRQRIQRQCWRLWWCPDLRV